MRFCAASAAVAEWAAYFAKPENEEVDLSGGKSGLPKGSSAYVTMATGLAQAARGGRCVTVKLK